MSGNSNRGDKINVSPIAGNAWRRVIHANAVVPDDESASQLVLVSVMPRRLQRCAGSISELLSPSCSRNAAWPIQVSASSAAWRSRMPSLGTNGTGTPVAGVRRRLS